MDEQSSGLRSTILNVSMTSLDDLYASYMPFVTHGGLFVKTAHRYRLGDQVLMVLELMDEPETYSLSGNVVWVAPAGGNRRLGVGVQLSEANPELIGKIETYLAGLLGSDRPTSTL